MTDSHTAIPPQPSEGTSRLSLTLFAPQHQWLADEAQRQGCSVAEVVRQLLNGAMTGSVTTPTPPAPEPEPEPELPRAPESLPAWHARYHTTEAVAIHMGLPLATVQGWLEQDQELRQACEEASWGYVLRLEARYVALGLGDGSGQRQALEGFLEAHHPAYGRVKAELVRRQLKPWCAKVLQALREAVGDATDIGRTVLRTFAERLQALERAAVEDFT